MEKSWNKFIDAGIKLIEGVEFYVSIGPSGNAYKTSVREANESKNPAEYRFYSDKKSMPHDEWQEVMRQLR